MQMTMTFSFDDPSEASVFLGKMSAVMAEVGAAVAQLFNKSDVPAPVSKKAALPPQTETRGCVPEVPPAPKEQPTDETSEVESETEDKTEEPAKTTRKRGSRAYQRSAEVHRPANEEPKTVEEPNAKEPAPAPKEVSLDTLREMVAVITKSKAKNGGSPAVFKVLAKYGAKRLPDLSVENRANAYADLLPLYVTDEIPF